ncbi:MAG: hypothetical protein VXB01_07540, partial [Opitutae bacterium]
AIIRITLGLAENAVLVTLRKIKERKMRLTGLKFMDSLECSESQKYQFNRADVLDYPVAELVLNAVFDSCLSNSESLIIASTRPEFLLDSMSASKAIAIERTPQNGRSPFIQI